MDIQVFAASRVYGEGKARDMYSVILRLLAWWDMEGASWGCNGRTMSRGLVKMGWGMGASVAETAGLAGAETWASIAAGCAGVGCAAIVRCESFLRPWLGVCFVLDESFRICGLRILELVGARADG